MFGIPKEALTTVFQDDVQLNSLYAPFRDHAVSLQDKEIKLNAWKQMIYLYCSNNSIYTFCANDLKKAFMHNGRPPSCLDAVILEMLKMGELQDNGQFFELSPKTWKGWATNLLIKKPVVWGYNKFKNLLYTPTPDKNYVHMKTIEDEANLLLAEIPENYKNKLLNLQQLTELAGSRFTDEKLEYLIHYLLKYRKIDCIDLKNDKQADFLIKIANSQGLKSIDETELAIYNLEQSEKQLHNYVKALEDQIHVCNTEIKSHLLNDHKQLAKMILKKRHETEKLRDKKLHVLHNIQLLLMRLHDAGVDSQIVDSYKAALEAFNTTYKATGLAEDVVEDTMLKIGDMLDLQDDVQASLGRTLTNDDDESLEKELDELMKNNERPTEHSLLNDNVLDEMMKKLDLSPVPDNTISKTTKKTPITQS